MKRYCLYALVVLLLISWPLNAQDVEDYTYDLTGQISNQLTYNHDLDQWENLLRADVEIYLEYGYNLEFYLNPEATFKTLFPDENDLNLELKEGYLDLYLDQMDLRLGKQLVNWGSAFKQNPTNKINPMDLTASDPTAAQLGVNAITADYYFNWNTILSGVIIGEFIPAVLPPVVNQTSQEELQNNIYQQLIAIIPDPATVGLLMQNLSVQTVEPEMKALDDLEFAFKLTQRDFYGYDLSLSYFSGYEDFPGVDADFESIIQKLATGQEATIQFNYPRTNTIGLDVIGQLQDIGAWLEGSLSINQDEKKTLEGLVGGDYTFSNNLYTIFQYYYRNQWDDGVKPDQYVMLHAQLPLRQIHQITTTFMYDLNANSILISPELQYSLNNNASLNVGLTYMKDLTDTSSSLLSSFGKTQAQISVSHGF